MCFCLVSDTKKLRSFVYAATSVTISRPTCADLILLLFYNIFHFYVVLPSIRGE